MIAPTCFASTGRRVWIARTLAAVVAGMCAACSPTADTAARDESPSVRHTESDDAAHRPIIGPRNFITGYDAANPDGTYNLVIEIPTGTSEKWEVCPAGAPLDVAKFPDCKEAGGAIVRNMRDGSPLVVQHVGYPGNYGALPGTLSGDGDPLDAIAVGPAAKRGDVVRVKVVGVIRCLDNGERDDKLIAVTSESPLFALDLDGPTALDEVARNASEMMFLWFTGYKDDASTMLCNPMEDASAARAIIDTARAAFATP